MQGTTIFHKIISKEIPAKIVYEDENIIAFHDIQPVAPYHLLVVPKVDLESIAFADQHHGKILGQLMLGCKKVAELEGLVNSGFRIVINNGEGVGQSVFQLHAHVLAGRDFKWPPG